jgi:hypothetical protein
MLSASRSSILGLIAIILLSAAGCAMAAEDAAIEKTGAAAEQALSAFQWNGATAVGQTAYSGGALGALNGTTYMVRGGRNCLACNELWWSSLRSDRTWTTPVRLARSAYGRPTLAAFNGYLYMLHSWSSDPSSGWWTDVWLARFNPTTQTWSPSILLPFKSLHAPAMAEYGGKLYITGSQPQTKKVWVATMDASEQFTAAEPLGWDVAMWAPALAVHEGRLFLAYVEAEQTHAGEIRYRSFDGVAWAPKQGVSGGINGEPQRYQPVLASYGGYLHMLHPERDNLIRWTYFRDGAWSPMVSLPGHTYGQKPALVAGGQGLVAVANASLASTTTDNPLEFWTYALSKWPGADPVNPPVFENVR